MMTRSTLSPFQQLLTKLMTLCLNLLGKDLAYRFGVHSSTTSRTFIYILEVLYSKLKPLIIWPDRDSLLKIKLIGVTPYGTVSFNLMGAERTEQVTSTLFSSGQSSSR